MKLESAQRSIVFYDGVCALCNSSVQFLLRIDKKSKLHFAPLQGETAKQLLPVAMCEDVDSMVFLKKGVLYTKSSAVLHLFKAVGGFWSVFFCFIVLPKSFRDAIYKYIAKNRYKWFGKYDTCKILNAREKKVLLD